MNPLLWKLSQFSRRDKFQNARATSVCRQGSNCRPYLFYQGQTLCHLSHWWSTFTPWNVQVFVYKYTTYLDVQPRWQVDVYQQNVFYRGHNGAENNIPNQELVFIRIHANVTNSKNSVRRPDFHSRCRPGVFAEPPVLGWNLIFVLLSKILQSFKTVICSANSPSHSLSRECWTYSTLNSFSLAMWRNWNEGDLFGNPKIDTIKSCIQLLNCTMIQRTPWQGIVQRGFPTFERMKKFHYGHSATKCTRYPFDNRAKGGLQRTKKSNPDHMDSRTRVGKIAETLSS